MFQIWVTCHSTTNAPTDYKVTNIPHVLLLVSMSPEFRSVSMYNHPFARYLVVKTRKCTEWSQDDLQYLLITSKSTLYILSSYTRSTNFSMFSSTTNRFQETRFSKLGYTGWPQHDIKHLLTVKRILSTLNTLPVAPNLARFDLQSDTRAFISPNGFWFGGTGYSKRLEGGGGGGGQ